MSKSRVVNAFGMRERVEQRVGGTLGDSGHKVQNGTRKKRGRSWGRKSGLHHHKGRWANNKAQITPNEGGGANAGLAVRQRRKNRDR